MTLDSQRIVALLAEESRRRVAAVLMLSEGALSTAEVADRARLDLRDAVEALDRLSELVHEADGGWRIDAGAFEEAVRREAGGRTPSAFSDAPPDIAEILDRSFSNGRLLHLPTKRSKRLIVLDHLAQMFEIGHRYPEAAVNERLRTVHDDVAMLRRWLVDEQFLDRSDGDYWRCGGSV